jgi:hypothetical protein
LLLYMYIIPFGLLACFSIYAAFQGISPIGIESDYFLIVLLLPLVPLTHFYASTSKLRSVLPPPTPAPPPPLPTDS